MRTLSFRKAHYSGEHGVHLAKQSSNENVKANS